MSSNLEKYKNDLKELISKGEKLQNAMQAEFMPERFREALEKALKDEKKVTKFLKELPSFTSDYQSWYSESLVLIKLLIPDRVDDFIDHYKKPKTKRKDITYENYVIEDALQGLHITRGWEKEKVVGTDAAIPHFSQQLNILKSAERRFESSLFDIKQLVQADLFDSELDSAKELNKKGFARGAGAVAGVVLEKHLAQVCDNHNLKITKKNPTINDLNQILKDAEVTEVKDWRFIQRLADLRNLCDHDKKTEPKHEDIDELIEGVEKISKTIF